MKKNKINVSVIIPTYHDWKRLKICINALSNQTYFDDCYEVIIVNNDPKDSPPNLNLPSNFRIISEIKSGSYAARNAGIKQAEGEILAFTDSDCIPDNLWIENAVKLLETGEERIAGHIELFYRSEKLNVIEYYEKYFAFKQKKSAENGASLTANLITWKRNFDAVGLFNENLMSGGDNEWGWRATSQGIPIVYSENVIVKHPARYKLKQLLKKNRRVLGGKLDIHDEEKFSLTSFIRGFLPPIRKMKNVVQRFDIPIRMKITLSLLLYLIKVHDYAYFIALKLDLVDPQRV
ncbi:MAG: glycosyltransferase [Candidatus Paceibacterota bacterium]